MTEIRTPTEIEEFFFDLNGYVVIRNTIDGSRLRAMVEMLSGLADLPVGEWRGYVHHQNQGAPKFGTNLQNIIEAGDAFAWLIDNPSWIGYMRRFVDTDGVHAVHGGLFLDENFANIRGPSEFIGLHSGGHEPRLRTTYRWRNGEFACGQVNVLVALEPMGPGDGGTMVIPGSHKANLKHPQLDYSSRYATEDLSAVEGAVEVHLDAGDAVIFVDAILHGSAARLNPGTRKVLIYRYVPEWSARRYGYQISPDLLERLTEEQRKIVLGTPPTYPPGVAARVTDAMRLEPTD